MSNRTITVELRARHNTGNYEHVEAGVVANVVLHDAEDPAAAVIALQKRLAPLITISHVSGLMAGALTPAVNVTVAASTPATSVASASDAEPPKRGRGRPRKNPAADPLAGDDDTPAGGWLPPGSDDPLAADAPADPIGPGEKAEVDAAVAADPLLAPDAPAAVVKAAKAAAVSGPSRTAIIQWAAATPENGAALNRALKVYDYDRLRDVPDAELADLATVLGIAG